MARRRLYRVDLKSAQGEHFFETQFYLEIQDPELSKERLSNENCRWHPRRFIVALSDGARDDAEIWSFFLHNTCFQQEINENRKKKLRGIKTNALFFYSTVYSRKKKKNEVFYTRVRNTWQLTLVAMCESCTIVWCGRLLLVKLEQQANLVTRDSYINFQHDKSA